MNHSIQKICWLIAASCMLLLAVSPIAAQETDIERHQVIGGISIYLGVLPIQMAINEADELNLPAKVYKLKHRYYVLLAMFDSKSGSRIVDADIKASVSAQGGLNFSEKRLKPVHIEKLISFGNYFRMTDPDVYTIKATIRLPDSDKTFTARFIHHRASD